VGVTTLALLEHRQRATFLEVVVDETQHLGVPRPRGAGRGSHRRDQLLSTAVVAEEGPQDAFDLEAAPPALTRATRSTLTALVGDRVLLARPMTGRASTDTSGGDGPTAPRA